MNSSFFFCTIDSKEKECFLIFPDRMSHSKHQNTLEELPPELTINFEFKRKLGQGSYSYAFEVFDNIHQD